MHVFDLLVARSTADLEHMLADTQGKILAGGTDLILFMEAGKLRPQTVLDISRLRELRYIRGDAERISVGPLTTHGDLARSLLLREWAPILPMAAATIGAVQVRNRGTVGGNLATASPAGDTIAALMALGASVTLRSVRGERHVALEHFFSGPGKTVLAADEYIAEIGFPTPPVSAHGVFHKVGRRKAQAVALVSVGVQVVRHDGRVGDARITLGAVAPTVMRAVAAEDALRGQRLTGDLCRQVAELAAGEARPISDIRASAEYRRKLVKIWVRRALEALMV